MINSLLHDVMNLPKYDKNKNTKQYNIFFYKYMKIQMFTNYCYNMLSLIENQEEIKNNSNWNKQLDSSYFQVPYKNNIFSDVDDLVNIESIRLIVKKQMGLTKDYYFIHEESSVNEFMQLFSTFEYYLKDLLGEIIVENKKKYFAKLRLKRENEKLLITKIMNNIEITKKDKYHLLVDSIDSYLKKNVTEFLKEILKLVPSKEKKRLNDMGYDFEEFKIEVDKFRELRNLHIHNLGIKNGKYEKIGGLYKVELFRSTLLQFVPILDETIKRTLLKSQNDSSTEAVHS